MIIPVQLVIEPPAVLGGSKGIEMISWESPGAGEPISHEFDACWHCGRASDGGPDPFFRVADDIDPRELPTLDYDTTYLPYPPWS